MKRTKLLALMLVLTVMLMGAGYAFWSDVLAIDTTVNTGELKFEFSGGQVIGGDYVTGSVDVVQDGRALDVKIDNMHPGATATVEFCIKNTGTIGLKIGDFEVIGSGANFEQLGVFKSKGKTLTIEEYLSKLTKELGKKSVDPGQEICGQIEFIVDKHATEEDFAQLSSFEFTMKVKAKQYNQGNGNGNGQGGSGSSGGCGGHEGEDDHGEGGGCGGGSGSSGGGSSIEHGGGCSGGSGGSSGGGCGGGSGSSGGGCGGHEDGDDHEHGEGGGCGGGSGSNGGGGNSGGGCGGHEDGGGCDGNH